MVSPRLLDHTVIGLVGADPVPDNHIPAAIANHAIVFTDHRAPGSGTRSRNWLKRQTGMDGVLLEEVIGGACLTLGINWQRLEEFAKLLRSSRDQHYSQPPSSVSPSASSCSTSR